MSAPAARNLFQEQARNRRATWLLILAFVGFLGLLGLGFDAFVLGRLPSGGRGLPFPVGTTAASLIGAGSALLSYRFGDRAVLASSGARPVDPQDAGTRILRNVVAEMSIASGLPEPALHVISDPDPNAFATGRSPAHASIAVTSGLLSTMNREELQGVIAHEMAHVRNYDIRTMTVVAALLGAVVLLSDWTSRVRVGAPSRGSRREDRDSGGHGGGPLALVLFAVWLTAVVLAPLLGRLLATAVSRNREYLADASGAELTRNPLGLASALRKLGAASAPTRSIHRGTAHLCITDPLARAVNERSGWLADLLATHPPLSARIARLEAMAYRPPAPAGPAPAEESPP